jgi:hypothetical protein
MVLRGYWIMSLMRATWRVILDGAVDEVLLAVDLYNQPRQPRRLEAFLVHMHIAWLYLLQAQFKRAGIDYYYRLPNGWYERVNGEPRSWELQRCVRERWPQVGAVRKNLELSIALRNKIEHRYHEAVTLVTSGYAQALLLNYEEELTSRFGQSYSLGEQLRFPIFVGSITAVGRAQIEQLRGTLPKDARDFLANFEADLDPAIASDQRYEFRVNLVPKLGPKTEADTSLTFVREEELTDEERAFLAELGRAGRVVVREQTRLVASAGLVKPAVAADLIETKIPFEFRVHHVVRAWQKMGCRPPQGDPHPERTQEQYCIYDEPHRDYLFKPAFITKVARETNSESKFQAFLGLSPTRKSSQ